MPDTILSTHRGSGMLKGEPKLEEVLSEPIVLLRARRAGLSEQALRALCQKVRQRLKAASKP